MDLKQAVREDDISAITHLVTDIIPGARYNRTPNLLHFTLPLSSTNRFSGI